MSRITFTSHHEETGRELTMKLGEDQTWHDVSEEFLAFLQGCGYIVDRKSFAEYWSQYADTAQYHSTIIIQPHD